MRVVIIGVRADGAGEKLGNVLPSLVDSRKHNVAGRLIIELLDAFPEV